MHVRSGILATLSAAIAIATFGIATAHAATLNITESTDFAPTGFTSLGTLGIGLNSITGIVSLSGGDITGFDTDTFSVILPAGEEITSGSWAITTFDGEPSSLKGSVDDPLGGLASSLSVETIALTGPYTTPGALDISAAGAQSCSTANPPVCTYLGFRYTLDYTVAAIPPVQSPSATPEPSSLILLGTGLLGFVGVARRKLLN